MLFRSHLPLRAFFIVAGSLVPTMAEKGDEALVVSFLQEHCADCHGEKKQKAKFALHEINPDIVGGKDLERWEKILEMISIGDMPPEDEPQPKAKQREQVMAWISSELEKVGRGPIAGSSAFPNHGNRVNHDALFSGEYKGPSYTTSRLWRISPQIYQRFASNIEMARKFNAPLQTASAEGIKDYSLLFADEATIKTMLQNCKRAATTMIHGRIKTTKNRSSSTETKQGGRTGTKHREIANFIATDGVPSAEEMNSVLKFAIKLFLNRPSTEADQKRYIDGFLKSNCELAKRDVALGGMLTTIMISPEFLYRMELGLGEKLPDGRRMLAPREIAYALSFSLFDYVEKKTLQAADDRRLATKEDVAREFRRMLSEPDRGVRGAVGKHLWVTGKGAGITNARLLEASYPRLLRFFREYFGYLKVNDVFKDDTRHDGRHDAFARVQEVDWFVLNILRDDKHVLNRLLTDDWYFAALRKNSRKTYQAPVYNIDEDREWPIHPEGFKLATVKMPDGQRAGMLTHPTWLAAHSGNFKNDPVRRGKWIQEHLLAGIVPDIPIVVAAQLPENLTGLCVNDLML